MPQNVFEKVRLFLDYTSRRPDSEAPGPFYGGSESFKHVLDLVDAASEGLLEYIRRLRDGRAS